MTEATESAPPAKSSNGRLTVTRLEFARMLGIGSATFDKHRDKFPKPLDMGTRKALYSRTEVEAFLAGKRL